MIGVGFFFILFALVAPNISGMFTESGDCSSTTRTTSRETTATAATDTTSTSNFCPPLPQDGGSWICIPEVKHLAAM